MLFLVIVILKAGNDFPRLQNILAACSCCVEVIVNAYAFDRILQRARRYFFIPLFRLLNLCDIDCSALARYLYRIIRWQIFLHRTVLFIIYAVR